MMRYLKYKEIELVQGGFLPMLIAAVTIFTLPKLINDHRKEYNQWGQALGEAAWEYQHPYDPNR